MIPKQFLVPPAPYTRLGEPSFSDDASDVYGLALDTLIEEDVPFLVGGALAMNHYTGVWRDTKDLDLFLKPEDVAPALDALAEAGLQTERVYRSWLSKAWEGDTFVDLIHRNASGVHPPDDRWFERAPLGSVLGRVVPFVPPEELIFSKLFVGTRYRYDGADVLHIVFAAHDRIDWDHLLERAGHECAGLLLAHLELYRWVYPAFADQAPSHVVETLRERAAEDAASPSTSFRGRLLDLNAFEVDVAGWDLPDAHAERMRDILGPGVVDAVHDDPEAEGGAQ